MEGDLTPEVLAIAYDTPLPDSPATEAFLEQREFIKQIASPVGVTGLNYSDRWIFEEFIPQLRNPEACKIYQEMSDNDATISAVLYMIEQLVMRTKWTVEPGGKSAADLEKAKFLEECMHDMEDSWADFIQEILSMFIYGYSFHEVIFKYRRGKIRNSKLSSKYNDGRIGWRKIPIRAQSSMVGWEFDEEGDAVAFIQQCPPTYKQVTIPFSRGLLFRTKHTKNNPEGRSLLRGAYRSWFFKKRMEEIEGIGIERDLAGLPVITPAEGVDIWSDTKEAKEKLAKATAIVSKVKKDRANGVVKPFGWTLELLSAGSSKQINTTEIINRYDQRMAITLLSDIVMLGADKVGSFALADVKRSLLSASIEAHLARIANIINTQAVPTLMSYNTFPETLEEPMVVPGEVETPDIKDIATALKAVNFNIYSSIKITNAFLDLLSLPNITEEELAEIRRTEEVKNKNAMSRQNPKGDGPDDSNKDPFEEGKSSSNNEDD